MKQNLGKIVTILVLAVAAYVGFVYVRFFLYTMKVREAVDAVPRFPSREEISGVDTKLKELAASSHIPVETFGCDLSVRGKQIGNDRWYYIVVQVKDGSSFVPPRKFEFEKHDRIENWDQIISHETDWLESHNVKFVR